MQNHIVHVIDIETGFNATTLITSSQAQEAINVLESTWINPNGATKPMIANVKFATRFTREMKLLKTIFNAVSVFMQETWRFETKEFYAGLLMQRYTKDMNKQGPPSRTA